MTLILSLAGCHIYHVCLTHGGKSTHREIWFFKAFFYEYQVVLYISLTHYYVFLVQL